MTLLSFGASFAAVTFGTSYHDVEMATDDSWAMAAANLFARTIRPSIIDGAKVAGSRRGGRERTR